MVILKVTDSNGNTLTEWKPTPGVRVLSPQVAWLVNDVLKPVGAPLHITRPFSSKTGTTENWHDSWFIGFNPDIFIGSWMGHTCAGVCPSGENSDLSTPAGVVWGAFGPGLIFRDIFNAYEASQPVHDWTRPDGLKQVTVCKASGLRATAACSSAGQTVTDWFVAGLTPNRDDDWYKVVRVCTTDGLLAAPDTPTQLIATKTFVVYPPGYPDELKAKDNPTMPTQTCSVMTETIPPTLQPLMLTQLPDGGITITAVPQDDQAIMEVDFFLDGAETQGAPGDLVRLPMGKPHGIFNKSGRTAKTLFWVSPTRRLYDLFWAIHNMKQQNPDDVVKLAAEHNIHFLPPPPG